MEGEMGVREEVMDEVVRKYSKSCTMLCKSLRHKKKKIKKKKSNYEIKRENKISKKI